MSKCKACPACLDGLCLNLLRDIRWEALREANNGRTAKEYKEIARNREHEWLKIKSLITNYIDKHQSEPADKKVSTDDELALNIAKAFKRIGDPEFIEQLKKSDKELDRMLDQLRRDSRVDPKLLDEFVDLENMSNTDVELAKAIETIHEELNNNFGADFDCFCDSMNPVDGPCSYCIINTQLDYILACPMSVDVEDVVKEICTGEYIAFEPDYIRGVLTQLISRYPSTGQAIDIQGLAEMLHTKQLQNTFSDAVKMSIIENRANIIKEYKDLITEHLTSCKCEEFKPINACSFCITEKDQQISQLQAELEKARQNYRDAKFELGQARSEIIKQKGE